MKKIYSSLYSYFKVIVMAVLLAVVYYLFVVENHFAPAGLNGIATMIQYKTGFSIGYMSLIINVPLCLLAFVFIDRSFAKRTLVFCLAYSFCYIALQKTGIHNIQYNANGHDTIYPVILSGVIGGVVYGVCFKNNASTGGTDIISRYVSKIEPEFNFFKITFIFNAIVAIVSFFVYAQPAGNNVYEYDYKPVCLCLIYCFLSAFVGDFIIKGTKKAYQFTIITNYPEEIIYEISNKLKHSVTKVTAVGSYTNNEKTVLICVINRHQIADLKDILSKFDDTFSFSEIVSEVYGNFKHIKISAKHINERK